MPVEKVINKKSFKAKDPETGEKLDLAVLRPSAEQLTKAQRFHNKTYREAIEAGGLLKSALEGYLKDQGVWSKSQQDEHDNLSKALLEDIRKLKKGGMKLSQAYALAIKIRKTRAKLRELLARKNEEELNTVDAQAEAARFNILISLCTVYDDGRGCYFKDFQDFQDKANSALVGKAGSALAEVMYNGLTLARNLPENEFLIKYGFMDSNCQLINKDKQAVDEDGKVLSQQPISSPADSDDYEEEDEMPFEDDRE
jgi:ATP-dependent exoDNAse (exonuclease V) beta subunit